MSLLMWTSLTFDYTLTQYNKHMDEIWKFDNFGKGKTNRLNSLDIIYHSLDIIYHSLDIV